MPKSDEDYRIILEELIHFLGGICILCLKPYPDGKTWQIHHRKYRCADCGKTLKSNDKKCPHCGGKPEKTSKYFKTRVPHIITRGKRKGKKTHKTIYDKLGYHEYLRPIVLGRPNPTKDFGPMHLNCHLQIGKVVMYNKDKARRQRLCDLIMEQD